MIDLTPALRRALRARAHHLNPVVTVASNGLSVSVVAEIKRSLQAHELIKVRLQGVEREQRDELMRAICAEVDAAPVQTIGNVLVIWREREEEAKAPAPKTDAVKADKAPSRAKSAGAFASNARRAAQLSGAKRTAFKPTMPRTGKPRGR